MRESKIVEGRDYFATILRNNGECLEGSFTAHVDALKLIVKIFNNNIIANNTNWAETLKDHYSS